MVAAMLGIRPGATFIQTIVPHGLSLPKKPKGDQVWQHSETAQQPDGRIQDFSADREVQALDNQEHYQSHSQTVDDHSKETVGGVKTIEALGAMKLLSGGSMSVAAVDDLHQATGHDLNLVVGDKYNATVGGDMQERIEDLRMSMAGNSQCLQAPRTWIGSEKVNVLQILCNLLELVEQMIFHVSSHMHETNAVPNNTVAFTQIATSTAGLATQLRGVML